MPYPRPGVDPSRPGADAMVTGARSSALCSTQCPCSGRQSRRAAHVRPPQTFPRGGRHGRRARRSRHRCGRPGRYAETRRGGRSDLGTGAAGVLHPGTHLGLLRAVRVDAGAEERSRRPCIRMRLPARSTGLRRTGRAHSPDRRHPATGHRSRPADRLAGDQPGWARGIRHRRAAGDRTGDRQRRGRAAVRPHRVRPPRSRGEHARDRLPGPGRAGRPAGRRDRGQRPRGVQP